MGIHADLHVHTTHSDGSLTLETLPTAAKEAGVSAVAVTDHDAVHPGLDQRVVESEGVTIIRGIELRVSPEGLDECIDLLGYGVEKTDELMHEVERLQENRVERAQEIISRVETEYSVELGLTPSAGVGRPHIARAIDAHSGVPYSYAEAFDHVIGRECSAYVARDVTSFEKGIELLTEACSVVVLAHPFRYTDPESALQLTTHLDGVEYYYPYSSVVKDGDQMLDEVVGENDLLVTGGSDAHELTVGATGVEKGEFEEVLSEIEE